MTDLILPLKREYFEQIKAGTKAEEYRLVTPYWTRRLDRRHFTRLILTLGYPPKDDASRRIELPYRGYEIKTITHPHFGPEPVRVYAIHLR
ncbi:ASCH domain-containing protein [Allopusillimonas ginsengisoli]|uniref:ASCH domain-containing protein n=1 Tax=Allopusillimonas ginsengisoli TaxID=453575 RepID=UPI001020AA4A|nr:ASCH domain-containing protein [Allopusillimonas ginsengisoli]TEA78684.1 ASCH domain-containing protein [Allopusillimonas ginsengisoli]